MVNEQTGMKPQLLALARWVDDVFIRATLPFTEAKDGLVVLLFHTLHADADELNQGLIDTRYAITVDKFRETLAHFLDAGYTPVTPSALLNPPTGKRLLVTFDDGYFNNVLALPVLEALQVPATFFIATAYLQEGRSYWWDTLIRERTTAGTPLPEIRTELSQYANQPYAAVDAYIESTFGPSATRPVGDVDRPMTPDELHRFAEHPLVTLGNHTHNHASLVYHDAAAITRQITLAQAALQDMAGVTPACISYPNGKHDDRVLRTVAETGITLGFTSRPRKTYGLSKQPLAIGRFVVSEADTIGPTCTRIRADYSLLRTYTKRKRLAR